MKLFSFLFNIPSKEVNQWVNKSVIRINKNNPIRKKHIGWWAISQSGIVFKIKSVAKSGGLFGMGKTYYDTDMGIFSEDGNTTDVDGYSGLITSDWFPTKIGFISKDKEELIKLYENYLSNFVRKY